MSKSVKSKFELRISKWNIGKFIFASLMTYFCQNVNDIMFYAKTKHDKH